MSIVSHVKNPHTYLILTRMVLPFKYRHVGKISLLIWKLFRVSGITSHSCFLVWCCSKTEIVLHLYFNDIVYLSGTHKVWPGPMMQTVLQRQNAAK